MTTRIASGILHSTAAVVIAFTLVAVAQPLFSEDTWWHLSMGRAYASAGPWLATDPVLFTAQGPPAPAAWLTSLGLHGTERLLGFQGLRLLHAAWVAAILMSGWWCLRRVSDSAGYASAATAIFSALSAYRLFQLRPDLVSILAAILLVWLLVVRKLPLAGSRNSKLTIAASIAGMGLWANAHAGFLLGPILLACAVAGLAIARLAGAPQPDRLDARMRWLAIALGSGLLATFVNPTGALPHGLYFSAGSATPALSIVIDEWRALDLFALPVANLPPSPFSWIAVWMLFAVSAWALVRGTRSVINPTPGASNPPDPALLAIAAISLVALVAAVRFSWMAFFVLLAIGDCARAAGLLGSRPSRWKIAAAAVVCGATLYGYIGYGAWPMISRAVHPATYPRAYTSAKNHAHAVWFLRDTGIEGRLFNDYRSGNFLGYWLAPALRTFVNGSLNVPRQVMDATFAVERRGWESQTSFEDLLDHFAVDVFFATGVPRLARPNRPVVSTTTHLESTPGWMLVFRNLSSAVYLRIHERNRDNLGRIAAYYACADVPFDTKAGFDVEHVIAQAPGWAVAHGLIPRDFAQLEARTRVADPTPRLLARDRLAALLATLGAYAHAAPIDRGILREQPHALLAARRLLWTLLHLRADAEASVLAEALDASAAPTDEISRALIDTTRLLPSLSEAQRRALVAMLPMMTRIQARQLGTGMMNPEVRSGDLRTKTGRCGSRDDR